MRHGAADYVDIAIAIDIDWLRVDRPRHFGENVLDPGAIVERGAVDLEKRDRLWLLRRSLRILGALVCSDDFRAAIVVEIGEKDAYEGAATQGCRRDMTRPVAIAYPRSRILKIDKMRELTCGDDIG